MDLSDAVYQEISRRPPEEIAAVLRTILPPAKLALLMEGTLFKFTEHGAGLFRIQTVLAEAGIPPEDPRTRLFHGLLGWLVDPHIPRQLHAIAQQQETRMGKLGAVKTFDASGHKAWWVPVRATSDFERERQGWFAAFETARDQLLVDRYDALYKDSRARVLRSAAAAWAELFALGRSQASKETYLNQAESIFTARFPSPTTIRARVRLSVRPAQAALPPALETVYRQLRGQAQALEEAALEQTRARARHAQEQLRLVEIERQLKEGEQARLQNEKALRARLVREAVQPEVEQARQMVLQVQARVIRLCQSILSRVQAGGTIAPATRRSWNRMLRSLLALTPDHPQLLEALQSCQALGRSRTPPSSSQVASAAAQVSLALADLERKAAVSIQAESLWQLLQAGQAEQALARLQEVRGQLSGRLEEVESLYELMTALGAEAETPEAAVPA